MKWTSLSTAGAAAAVACMAGSAAWSHAANNLQPKVHPPVWTLPGHGGFAFAFGSAWIAGGGRVFRVDPRTNRIEATIADAGTWPIATPDGIWTIEQSALDRIDPAKDKVVTRIPLEATSSDAYGFGSFWITTGDGSVVRVDPNAQKVVATIPVQGTPNWAPQIATGSGAVWVASADKHEIIKIDPTTNSVSSITPLGRADSLLTVGVAYGSVWAHENAAAQGRGVLYRIDPTSGTVRSQLTTSKRFGGQYGGTDIAFGADSIWTGNANGTVSRTASVGPKVLTAITTPLLTEFIALGFGSVWIQNDAGQAERLPIAKFTG